MNKYERLAHKLCCIFHHNSSNSEAEDSVVDALYDFSYESQADAKNAGSDITAKLLLEIAKTGEKHGVFGGELQEKAADAVFQLKQSDTYHREREKDLVKQVTDYIKRDILQCSMIKERDEKVASLKARLFDIAREAGIQ